MTEPAVYLTDRDLIRKIGVGLNAGARELKRMREHPRCPPRGLAGKTYWPAFRDFLDIWNGRNIAAPGIAAGQEDPNGKTKPTRRPRPSLAAAEELLGRGMGGASGRR